MTQKLFFKCHSPVNRIRVFGEMSDSRTRKTKYIIFLNNHFTPESKREIKKKNDVMSKGHRNWLERVPSG
jgi:hypothetical protein